MIRHADAFEQDPAGHYFGGPTGCDYEEPPPDWTPADILPRHIGHEVRSVSLLKDVCKRLRVPNDCKELAHIVAKFHGKLHQVLKMKPSTLVEFLTELDAFRQPERFKDFLKACIPE